jgi:hypothetical protein
VTQERNLLHPKLTLAQLSVQKIDGRRKTGPHRFRQFLQNSEKISEIRENSAETHQRRWRNSENREDRNVASFTNKSAGFARKSMWRFLSEFCQKPGEFC